MLDYLTLHRRVDEPERLLAEVDEGRLRAAAVLLTGPYAAIAFGEQPTDRSVTAVRLCPPWDPDCTGGLMKQSLLGPVSGFKPESVVAFVLLTVRKGALRTMLAAVERAELGDVRQAQALVYGSSGVQLLVEVLGDDADAVLDRVAELTDDEAVEAADVLATTGALTRGFGGREHLTAS